MAEFLPFVKFVEQIHALRPEIVQAALKPPEPGGVELAVDDGIEARTREAERMKEYMLELYQDVQVTHSFVGSDGRHVDCIPIDQQPGLRNVGPLANPPSPVLLEEGLELASETLTQVIDSPLIGDPRDQFGNLMACPPGFVPMRRVEITDLQRAGSLERFFHKAPGGGRHPTLGRGDALQPPLFPGPAQFPPSQSMGGVIHRYAHASQSVPNAGGTSWLNVWRPDTGQGVFSLSQQWYASYTNGVVQTVEGGWHVYPDFHANSTDPTAPRLFIYWTADGYVNTGSYNLERRPGQGGFVQIDNQWILGGPFLPNSSPGGAQVGFRMHWQRDDPGNWWLFLSGDGDLTAVGYYPVEIFAGGQMSRYAESIDFGGEVCSDVNSTVTGQMGSGARSNLGYQNAAFQKQVAYLDSSSTSAMKPANLTPMQDAPCYTTTVFNQSATSYKSYFFFGGPGCK